MPFAAFLRFELPAAMMFRRRHCCRHAVTLRLEPDAYTPLIFLRRCHYYH